MTQNQGISKDDWQAVAAIAKTLQIYMQSYILGHCEQESLLPEIDLLNREIMTVNEHIRRMMAKDE